MAKKAAALRVEEIPAEEVSQESPDDDALTPEQSIAMHDQENFKLNGTPSQKGANMTQADAVRQAIAAGFDSPKGGTQWVREHLGIEINNFSGTKAQLKSRDKDDGEPRPRRQASPPPSATATMPTGFADDIVQLRELIEKAGGADDLREMATGLGGLLAKYGKDELGKLITAIG